MHYLDLPILQCQPSYLTLKETLKELEVTETKNFEALQSLDKGIRQWLCRLASSDLGWIGDEDRAEELRAAASQRLAMECGVTANSARIRKVELGSLTVELKEPGTTEDHLGRLTWGSSLILSRRLVREPELVKNKRVIELGAGTGLCGITADLVGAELVHVTDLPDIVPNLAQNVEINKSRCESYVLDWAKPEVTTQFEVCIISDPVYSREHPALLLQAVKEVNAKEILLQLPLRKGFEAERSQIFEGLERQQYTKIDGAEEPGRDLFGEQTFAYSRYIKEI